MTIAFVFSDTISTTRRDALQSHDMNFRNFYRTAHVVESLSRR